MTTTWAGRGSFAAARACVALASRASAQASAHAQRDGETEDGDCIAALHSVTPYIEPAPMAGSVVSDTLLHVDDAIFQAPPDLTSTSTKSPCSVPGLPFTSKVKVIGTTA